MCLARIPQKCPGIYRRSPFGNLQPLLRRFQRDCDDKYRPAESILDPGFLTCSTHCQLIDTQGRLTHADRHALPVLAANSDAGIQLQVITNH